MAASSKPNYFSSPTPGHSSSSSPEGGRSSAPSREGPATFSCHRNGTVIVRFSGEEQHLAESLTRSLGLVQQSPKVVLDLTSFGVLSSDAIGKLIHSAPGHEGAIVVTSATRSKLASLALIGGGNCTVSAPFRWDVLDCLPPEAAGAMDAAQSSALQEAFIRDHQRATLQGELSLSALYLPQHTAVPAILEHKEPDGRICLTATKPASTSDQYETLLEGIRALPLDQQCAVDVSAVDCHGRQIAALILMACRDRLAKGGSPLEILSGPNARILLRPEMGTKLGFKVA